MIDIEDVRGEELNKLYKNMNLYYTLTGAWKSLQNKSDADFNRSEKGYQLMAKQMSGRIADFLGYNTDKTELLSMAVGSFFPRNGMAGLEFITEYVVKKGIKLDSKQFAINCIEDSVGTGFDSIPLDFDEALKAYFDRKQEIPEVDVVRVCQDTISKVKQVERLKKDLNGGDLLFHVSEDVITESKKAGHVVGSNRLDELVSGLPQESPELTENEKEIMRKKIDRFIKVFGEEGIQEYIYSDGKE